MKKRLENSSAKTSKRIRKKKKRIKKTKPLRTFKFYVFPFKVRNSFVESNILTLFPRNLTLGIEEFLGQKNTMRETSRLSSPRLVSVLTAFPSLPPLPSRPSIFQSSVESIFLLSSSSSFSSAPLLLFLPQPTRYRSVGDIRSPRRDFMEIPERTKPMAEQTRCQLRARERVYRGSTCTRRYFLLNVSNERRGIR